MELVDVATAERPRLLRSLLLQFGPAVDIPGSASVIPDVDCWWIHYHSAVFSTEDKEAGRGFQMGDSTELYSFMQENIPTEPIKILLPDQEAM